MAKTFNKEKHFDLNFFKAKGMAYFDTLDFSDISNEEIREIVFSFTAFWNEVSESGGESQNSDSFWRENWGFYNLKNL